MKRILLKISGEAFSWPEGSIDISLARKLWDFLQNFFQKWYQIAIVVWGGNIYRGSKLISWWLSPTDSHSMSMLSTVFNAVTLKNILIERSVPSVVLDALDVRFLEQYTSDKWKKYLNEGKIVICSSGTWNPYFTTDSAWVLRALELDCEAIIKLTKVDGVYDRDPMQYKDAVYISEISYDDFLQKKLQVFDAAWIVMARDNKLPLFISKISDIWALENILNWWVAGSKIF